MNKRTVCISKMLMLNGFKSIDEMVTAAESGNLTQLREHLYLDEFIKDQRVIQRFGPLATRMVRKKIQSKPFVLNDQFNDDVPTWTRQVTPRQVIEITLTKGLSKPSKVSIDLDMRTATIDSKLPKSKRVLLEYRLFKTFPIKKFLCEAA